MGTIAGFPPAIGRIAEVGRETVREGLGLCAPVVSLKSITTGWQSQARYRNLFFFAAVYPIKNGPQEAQRHLLRVHLENACLLCDSMPKFTVAVSSRVAYAWMQVGTESGQVVRVSASANQACENRAGCCPDQSRFDASLGQGCGLATERIRALAIPFRSGTPPCSGFGRGVRASRVSPRREVRNSRTALRSELAISGDGFVCIGSCVIDRRVEKNP